MQELDTTVKKVLLMLTENKKLNITFIVDFIFYSKFFVDIKFQLKIILKLN
jgi:hypothetical protein